MTTLSLVSGAEPELPVERHPALTYIASLTTEKSRQSMRSTLNILAGLASQGQRDMLTLPWHRLRYQHVVALKTLLIEKYAPATVNKYLAALRRVLQESWLLGHITAEEYQRAAAVRGVRIDTFPVGRDISYGEVRALLDVCAADYGPAGRRDAAIIALLYAGLRRSEIVALDLDDYDPANGQVFIVNAKGHKDRTTFLDVGSQAALQAWLDLRGTAKGPLIWPISMQPRRLTDQTVYLMIKRRIVGTGIAHLTPHDFRRTAVGDLLDAGADVATVARMMGHSNVNTAAQYDRRGDRAKEKAASSRRLPYRSQDD